MFENIPRMDTIKNAAKAFNLPEHFIRQKVKRGEIVAVKAGKKYLVNVDKLAEYLNSHTVTEPDKGNPSFGSTPISTLLGGLYNEKS